MRVFFVYLHKSAHFNNIQFYSQMFVQIKYFLHFRVDSNKQKLEKFATFFGTHTNTTQIKSLLSQKSLKIMK
jgi:hypothetical protein